jgi:formate dehydrogenase
LCALLGERSRRRDPLSEHLHLIQDRKDCLPATLLQALATEMGLALAEVYEVASFYAHFDIVLENEDPPPPLTVRVCDSLSCALADAEAILKGLEAESGRELRVLRSPCMGRCEQAPVAQVGRNHLTGVSLEGLRAALAGGPQEPKIPPYADLESYRSGGGYKLLAACRAGELTPDEVIARLSDSGLRGLGGAGFPTGQKWKFVRAEPAPRLMAVNGDEGEPGTFKDRYYLERDPHRFLEGTLIAAWACEVEACYVYIRDEYPAILTVLEREIARLDDEGLLGDLKVVLRRGAGAYICGEESAMLESIEGKRGLPRHKPPFPSQRGLFERPTLINNVETLYWVRDILEKGPAWFTGQGRRERKGLRSFSVSGRVAEPGVKLAPAGITVRELIEEFCGGMPEGHRFKAYLPGGASGGILPAALADIPLDFGTLEAHGSFIGSAAVIVLSDQDDMKAVARNLMHFFEDESCGQCTPCRNGTEKALALMAGESWDREALGALSTVMRDASICGLGQAAPNPLDSVLKHFPEEM